MARERKKRVVPLSNNVLYNEKLLPYYFILMSLFLNNFYGIPYFDKKNMGALFFSFLSTLIYWFSSNYFQPDLDVRKNRPGMGHFPIGRWTQTWKIGRFLRYLIYPINRLWYYFWQPYATLLTHRGVGHYPIIGTWIRVGYLWLGLIIFNKILLYLSIDFKPLVIFIKYLENFYPWGENFLKIDWVLFCFPIYLTDLVHIGVDFRDSQRAGYSFCPPEIPRGWIIKTIKLIKGEDI